MTATRPAGIGEITSRPRRCGGPATALCQTGSCWHAHAHQLGPRADPELAEDLAQVVVDRARAAICRRRRAPRSAAPAGSAGRASRGRAAWPSRRSRAARRRRAPPTAERRPGGRRSAGERPGAQTPVVHEPAWPTHVLPAAPGRISRAPAAGKQTAAPPWSEHRRRDHLGQATHRRCVRYLVSVLTEGEGFEPSVQGLPTQRFSRPGRSGRSTAWQLAHASRGNSRGNESHALACSARKRLDRGSRCAGSEASSASPMTSNARATERICP